MAYDETGNLSSIAYPSGRVVKDYYDTATHLTQVAFDNWNGAPVGYNYLSGITYAPQGAPTSLPYGNGLTGTAAYNNILQITGQTLSSSVVNALNRSFGFTPGQNNGSVMSVSDNLQPNRTQTFTYDSLNRISTAASNATSGPDCWAQQFGYDAWSNLLTATPTRSGCGMTGLNNSINPNNQVTGTGLSYDAAGNLLTDGSHTYAYDAEGRLSQVDSGTTAAYVYTGAGLRAQKQAGASTTEYVYLGGQPIAEYNPSTGDWSDYIYANGALLARADNYDNRLHMQGTNCSNCGWQYTGYNLNSLGGYVIRSGDTLLLRQYQQVAQGGIDIVFTDTTSTNWNTYDKDGQQLNNDTYQNTWHLRNVDLSAYAGKTISSFNLDVDGYTPAGTWNAYFSDIAIVNTDGTVLPVYNRQASFSASEWGTSGVTGRLFEVNHSASSADAEIPMTTTTFYHADHLGSARLLAAAAGWPVQSATYLPFGIEWNPQITVNHYKFTGDERDAETSLDHTQFRQYSSQFGRWMTPDPAGRAAVNLNNPQSWNRYAYVTNRTLSLRDPFGLDGGDCGGPVDAARRVRASFRRSGGRTGRSPRGMDDCLDSSGSGGGVGGSADPGAPTDNGFGPGNLPLDPNGGAGIDGTGLSTIQSPDGSYIFSNLIPDLPSSNSPLDPGTGSLVPATYADETLQQLAPGIVSGAGIIGDPSFVPSFYAISAASAACIVIGFRSCTALIVAVSILNEYFNANPELGPPQTGHPLGDEPNGGYIGPEPAPISGPPAPPLV